MSRDRSLDDFLAGDEADGDERETRERADPTPTSGDTGADDGPDADADTATATDNDARTDGADTAEGEASGLDVRPAESTMDWTPGGAPCEACGGSVERRWRDDGRLVCRDCKAW